MRPTMHKGHKKEEEDRNTVKNFSNPSGIKYLKIHNINIRKEQDGLILKIILLGVSAHHMQVLEAWNLQTSVHTINHER